MAIANLKQRRAGQARNYNKETFALHAFYETNRAAYPMTMEATCAYVWLQQAFLAFFDVWVLDREIMESVVSGNVAYELCRPLHIYDM